MRTLAPPDQAFVSSWYGLGSRKMPFSARPRTGMIVEVPFVPAGGTDIGKGIGVPYEIFMM
jgi:hypothetical protein